MSPTLIPKLPSLVMHFKISVNPTFCKLPLHPVSLLDVQCSREKVVEIQCKWPPLELYPRTKSSGYESEVKVEICLLFISIYPVCLLSPSWRRRVRIVTMSPFFYLWCTPNFIKIQLKNTNYNRSPEWFTFGRLQIYFDFVNCCGKPFFLFTIFEFIPGIPGGLF